MSGDECPARCSKCGEPLLLRAPGRELCQLCWSGKERKGQPTAPERQPARTDAIPCKGCGRAHSDHVDGYLLALADGYCLACRLDGRHQGVQEEHDVR